MKRRASVLVAALFVIVLGVLAAATMLDQAGLTTRTAARAADRVALRAAAWSGVQAAMAELDDQRDDILDGSAPGLTESFTLADEGGRRLVVRLVPWPADDSGEETLAVAENAKLDLNTADEAMLTRLAGAATARAILAARAARPVGGVEELAVDPAFSLRTIHGRAVRVGDPEDPDADPHTPTTNETLDSPAPAPDATGAPPAPDDGFRAARSLSELLTALSFDPNVQAGVGGQAASRGEVRVNINTPWSDALGQAIARRFGDEAAQSLRRLMDAGRTFERDSQVVAAMRDLGVSKDAWGEVLDTLTTSDDLFRPGRVDLSRASEAVLGAVPGVRRDAAAAIVRVRGTISRERLRSVAWPLLEGILTEDEFQLAVDHLTTRSAQWRVRVHAAYEPAESRTDDDATDRTTGPRCILEAVIDIGSTRPRVAFLREVSLLPIASAMEEALAIVAESDARSEGPRFDPPAGDPAPLDPEPPIVPDGLPPGPNSDSPGPDAPGEEKSAEGDASSRSPGKNQQPPPEMADRRRGRWTPGGP